MWWVFAGDDDNDSSSSSSKDAEIPDSESETIALCGTCKSPKNITNGNTCSMSLLSKRSRNHFINKVTANLNAFAKKKETRSDRWY